MTSRRMYGSGLCCRCGGNQVRRGARGPTGSRRDNSEPGFGSSNLFASLVRFPFRLGRPEGRDLFRASGTSTSEESMFHGHRRALATTTWFCLSWSVLSISLLTNRLYLFRLFSRMHVLYVHQDVVHCILLSLLGVVYLYLFLGLVLI